MAYFPNGLSGECFDKQCEICKYSNRLCPIEFVQLEYNYDACNTEIATKILNDLIKNDGTCKMFEKFRNDFFDNGEKQLELNFKG